MYCLFSLRTSLLYLGRWQIRSGSGKMFRDLESRHVKKVMWMSPSRR